MMDSAKSCYPIFFQFCNSLLKPKHDIKKCRGKIMKKQYCSNILQGHTSRKSPSFCWKNFHGKSPKILRTAPIYPHVTPYFWPLKISWNVKDLSMTRQCRLQWKTFYRKKPKISILKSSTPFFLGGISVSVSMPFMCRCHVIH